MVIKELSNKEFNDIFFKLIAEAECGKHFDINNSNHIAWMKNRINVHFLRGVKFFAYFMKDGTPVGFAALLIEEGLEGVSCSSQKSELLDIAIFPDFRGKGYGSELLNYTEEHSRQSMVYCMYISTYAKKYDVIAFYGKNGFVPVATLPDVHGPNDEGLVYMRKIL